MAEEKKDLILQEKGEAWKKQGLNVVKCEWWLSGKLNDLTTSLSLIKVTEENIQATEESIKEASDKIKEMADTRQKITRRFDEVKKRLSQFEKDGSYALDKVKLELLEVKKVVRTKQQAAQQKELQKVNLISAIKRAYGSHAAECQRVIDTSLIDGYKTMLETKTPLKDFDIATESFVSAVVLPTVKEFFLHERVDTSLLSPDEVVEIKKIAQQETPNYLESLSKSFRDKKVTYQTELLNAEEALRQNEAEAEERRKQREYIEKGKALADKMETIASSQAAQNTATIDGGKKLKEIYEIDMPETIESAMIIWACFSANMEEVLKHLRVNKWFACTPKQIGIALGKMKSNDNNFTFSNIVFKKIDKL